MLRHYTMINHWVSVYPCGPDDGTAVAGDYGDWYPAVLAERLSYWSAPYVDPATGRAAIALSLPLYCQEEDIFGVTSIIVDLDGLLGLSLDPSAAGRGRFAFVGKLTPDPQSGGTMIRIFSEIGSTAAPEGGLKPLPPKTWGFTGTMPPTRPSSVILDACAPRFIRSG